MSKLCVGFQDSVVYASYDVATYARRIVGGYERKGLKSLIKVTQLSECISSSHPRFPSRTFRGWVCTVVAWLLGQNGGGCSRADFTLVAATEGK